MWVPTPIICSVCKRDTGYTQEQFQYMVITKDILCPHCKAVVIKANNVMWNKINDRKVTPYFFEPVKFKAEIKL